MVISRFTAGLYRAALRRPRSTLALLVYAVFAIVTHGDFSEQDTARRLQVTHWLWTDAPQVAPGQRNSLAHVSDGGAHTSTGYCDLPGKNGEVYAVFGLGQSLTFLPADIVSTAIVDRVLAHRLPPSIHGPGLESIIVNLLTTPVVSSAAVILSYELLLLLGFSASVSFAAAVLLLTATTFVVYMQDVQENGLIYLCNVAALVLMLKGLDQRSRAKLAGSGAAIGFGLLIKLTNVVFLPGIALIPLWRRWRLRLPLDRGAGAWREDGIIAASFGLPVLAFIAIDRYYQFYRFGEWTSTYYKQCAAVIARFGGFPPGFPFGYDKWAGFSGPFISPDKSVFLFDPFLVFVLAFAIVAWRRMLAEQRLVLAGSAIAFVATAVGLAGFYQWDGSIGSWGPRLHLVPVETACLLGFALAIRDFARFGPALRALVMVLLGLSVAGQAIALPLRSSTLEDRQIVLGDPFRVVPLMRVRNLYHLLKGDFDAAGLARHDPVLENTATIAKFYARPDPHADTFDADIILVFRIAGRLPPKLASVLIAMWWALLAAATFLIALLVVGGFRTAAAADTPRRPRV